MLTTQSSTILTVPITIPITVPTTILTVTIAIPITVLTMPRGVMPSARVSVVLTTQSYPNSAKS